MKRKKPELKQLFIDRMKLLLEEKDFEEYLKILNQEPVKSIRCNTLKISAEKLKKRLEEKNWKISQPWKSNPEVMIVEGKWVDENKLNDDKIYDSNVKKTDDNNLKNIKDKKLKDIRTNEFRLIKLYPSSANEGSSNFGRAGGNPIIQKIFIPLEPGELGRALEHLLGYYYIQELASMLPIIALNPKPTEIVLDLCASPGSKTTQAAALMNNSGLIIANEVSIGRIKILSSNLERCGVTNTIITKKDGVAACERLKKFYPELKFDKILIDAPCSGEGTLRSSSKTYQMWNINTIKHLSRLQKKLITAAIGLLKDRGEIVYSTCTHTPEENEENVDFVLKNFPQMKIQKISLPVKCREGIRTWAEPKEIKNIDKIKNNLIKDKTDESKLLQLSQSANEMSSKNWAGGRDIFGQGETKKFSPKVRQSCRIYPQDNNTEGFFLAKFKKIN